MSSNGAMRRQLCVAADVRSYGRANTQLQLSHQRFLLEVLDEAGRRAGLERTRWWRSGSGDSEFAVLPDSEPEAVVVDRFVRELGAGLDRHNGQRVEAAKLRLRVAIHFGPVVPAENGYAGPAPVEVHRLLESAALKAALEDDPGADLALMLSDVVYRDTVHEGHTTLRPDEFEPVAVELKEFSGTAWLWSQGRSGERGTAGAAPATPPSAPGGPHVSTTINGSVSGSDLVFGIRNG